jgi:DnaJ-class molecular chaperone
MRHISKLLSLMLVMALALSLAACSSGGAKTATKVLQKVVKSKTTSKVVKCVGKYSDDVARHISTTTETCSTCAGLKQVDFVNEDGNYLYTINCPDCDGTGKVTKYGLK